LGEYKVYDGTFGLEVELAHDEIKNAKKLTARVTVVACNDKLCLAPATITVEMK
jgi:Disulphide bond corrector protein DsbC